MTFIRWAIRGRCRTRIMTPNPGRHTYRASVCYRLRFHPGDCKS